MTENLKPRDSADVEQTVRWALAGGKALEIVGRGSKRAIGRAAQWDVTLDLSRLSGVTLYEPEELVLSAKAGTPLAEIEALTAAPRRRDGRRHHRRHALRESFRSTTHQGGRRA